MSPKRLRFCQDSIARSFRDGSSVFDARPGIPKILACFHRECDGIRLFALNNRTLFNALRRDIGEVTVNIVEKPDDWDRRFTGSRPWMCVKLRGLAFVPQAVRIPAPAFPGGDRQSVCLVVLEVRNLINPQRDTLYELLKDMSDDLDVQRVEGPRAFARVRVDEDDAPLVRSMVKAIAKRMEKNASAVDCFEIRELRRYQSPRD